MPISFKQDKALHKNPGLFPVWIKQTGVFLFLLIVTTNTHPLQASAPPQISIAIQELSTHRYWGIADTLPFNPASTIKLLVMAAALQKVEDQTIRLEEKFSLLKQDRIWGSGQLYYASPGTQYSLHTLLKKMIQNSDNTATKMIIRIIGIDSINHTAKTLHLNDTQLKTADLLQAQNLNISTARDLVHLLALIHSKQAISKEASQIMLEILSTQQYKWGIPKYLPKTVSIAHKTGSLNGIKHDCGILTINNKSYAVAILTQSQLNDSEAGELVAKISKRIYTQLDDLQIQSANLK